MTYSHLVDRCPNCFSPRGGITTCSRCGHPDDTHRPVTALPVGTLLDSRYLTGKVLGRPGGFGITYLSLHAELGSLWAVKEYFPFEYASRNTDQLTVVPVTHESSSAYSEGLEKFVDEARHLAELQHIDYVVKVANYFRENGTAYIVMEYREGESLQDYLKRNNGLLPESEVTTIGIRLLEGLRAVHEHGILHRDIKPSNVYLTAPTIPMLLDFGAARIAVGRVTKSLSAVCSPGYTPFEQYQSKGKQGTWSDIYSIGATLYHCVTGSPPPSAPERMAEERLRRPRDIRAEISPALDAALMSALALSPEQRLQNANELIDRLKRRTARRSRPKPFPEPITSQRSNSYSAILLFTLGVALVAGFLSEFAVAILVLALGTVVYSNLLPKESPVRRSPRWQRLIPGYNIWAVWQFSHSQSPKAPYPVRILFLSGQYEGYEEELQPTQQHQVILGREPASAQIIFKSEDISRAHLEVRLTDDDSGAVIVEDLDSLNGTFYTASVDAQPSLPLWEPLKGQLRISANEREHNRYCFRLAETDNTFCLR